MANVEKKQESSPCVVLLWVEMMGQRKKEDTEQEAELMGEME